MNRDDSFSARVLILARARTECSPAGPVRRPPRPARCRRGALASVRVPVSASEQHEAIWEALPEGLEPPGFAQRRSFLLVRVRPGDRVLDVGCGEGRFAAELARAGATVLAADVAEEPL